MKTKTAIFASIGLALICRAQGIVLTLEIPVSEDPSFYSQGIRDALTSIHGKNDFVYGYLKDDCKLSNEEAVAALKYLAAEDFVEHVEQLRVDNGPIQQKSDER